MHQRTTRTRFLAILVLLATLALAGPAAARNDNPGVIPLNAKPYGKSYEQWSVAWWNWAISLPVTHHPLFDETGDDCGGGQSGPVWYLGGVFGFSGDAERTCAMPTGKGIFFPILNIFADNVTFSGPPTTLSEQQLIDTYCTPFLHNNASLAVELDGRSLQNLEGYEIKPTLFQYDMPKDDSLYDFFGVDWDGAPPPPGAVSCGYYLMLSPLSKGEHTLHVHSSTDAYDVADPADDFELDITYHLEVAAAGQFKSQGVGRTGARADHAHHKGNGGHHSRAGKHR